MSSRGVEAGLRRAIAAAPRALEPRAVYADWLESQGDPRAWFLRADLVYAAAPDDAGAWAALAEQGAALDPSAAAWADALALRYDVELVAVRPPGRDLLRVVGASLGISATDAKVLVRGVPSLVGRGLSGAHTGALRRHLAPSPTLRLPAGRSGAPRRRSTVRYLPMRGEVSLTRLSDRRLTQGLALDVQARVRRVLQTSPPLTEAGVAWADLLLMIERVRHASGGALTLGWRALGWEKP